jgi:hypothetical protein
VSQAQGPSRTSHSRRRPLDENTLVAVLARLAAGEPLARIAVRLQINRSTVVQTLHDEAWRCWVRDLGHPDLARPEVL